MKLDFPLTKERPTQEGWHWFRGRLNGRPPDDWMLYVWEEQGVFYVRERSGKPVKVADLDGEWNGPDLWNPGYPCQHRCEVTISGKNAPQRMIQCIKCARVRVAQPTAA